ncbi:hypothetical protein K439DRAFT_330896 [Ramaria rubella]|nr:hypothetical protein K439DRAFT_330896 [Ramaria rubella]
MSSINVPSKPAPNPKRGPKMSSSNQSLNHLLNFTLPPRQPHVNGPRRSNKKANASYGARSAERFVNAQYRFMMQPSGDYTVHFADPDISFQWHDVLQVIVPRTSATAAVGSHRDQGGPITCPICLSPPTAARMTRCGHVFCFSCILHYLNTSDIEKWIRCPICFDSVNEKQLKSVKWFDGTMTGETFASPEDELDFSSLPNSRKTLRMRLMQRPQITTLALPRSSTWPSELLAPHQTPFHFLPDVFTFSKFMLATPSCLNADLARDLEELQAERRILESMNDDLSILFVDTAELKVRSQIEEVNAMETELLRRAVDKAQRELADIQRREAKVQEALSKDVGAFLPPENTPEEFLSIKHDNPQMANARDASRGARSRRNVNPPPPSTSTYYYYQSASGSPIFLHPFDIRILLSHFNNYASFPNEIDVAVEALSEGAVNDDLRKRCKYLALPDGADVVFVEADLESVVGADALKGFEGALKTRRSKRKEKLKKDDRAKMRAEDKEKERVYGNGLQWNLDGFGSSVKIPDDWSTARPDAQAQTQTFQATPTQQPAGAWGSRSFASALHASPSTRIQGRTRRQDDDTHDEWDMDIAWHEMERRNGSKKQARSQKMVILGGGPGATRRR